MITRTSHLTPGHPDALAHQIRTTHPGQARFANTGPFAATCGKCVFLGYHRQIRNKSGDAVKTVHRGGCGKFYLLTGNHGPVVPKCTEACRYFAPRDDAYRGGKAI